MEEKFERSYLCAKEEKKRVNRIIVGMESMVRFVFGIYSGVRKLMEVVY